MSLDEHRAKFRANLYNRSTPHEDSLGTKEGEMPKAGVKRMALNVTEHAHDKDGMDPQDELAKLYPHEHFETDALEVWFAGSHTGILQLFSPEVRQLRLRCLLFRRRRGLCSKCDTTQPSSYPAQMDD